MAITSAEELKDKKLADIVSVYNELAAAVGKPAVKEFKSKAVGLTRVQQLLDAAASDSPNQAKTRTEKKEKAKEAFSKMEKPEPKAKKKPAAKTASKAAAKKTPAKAKGKSAKAGTEKKASTRGQGIGAFAMDLIRKGKTNEEVLAAVKAKFPDANTSASSVAWYRNKLKSDGEI